MDNAYHPATGSNRFGMINLNYNVPVDICCICSQVITNPICAACLEREVKEWLKAHDKHLIKELENTKDLFRSFITSSVRCIICGGKLKVCAHCYVSEVYELLLGLNEEIAMKFRKAFNYDLIVYKLTRD